MRERGNNNREFMYKSAQFTVGCPAEVGLQEGLTCRQGCGPVGKLQEVIPCTVGHMEEVTGSLGEKLASGPMRLVTSAECRG